MNLFKKAFALFKFLFLLAIEYRKAPARITIVRSEVLFTAKVIRLVPCMRSKCFAYSFSNAPVSGKYIQYKLFEITK